MMEPWTEDIRQPEEIVKDDDSVMDMCVKPSSTVRFKREV